MVYPYDNMYPSRPGDHPSQHPHNAAAPPSSQIPPNNPPSGFWTPYSTTDAHARPSVSYQRPEPGRTQSSSAPQKVIHVITKKLHGYVYSLEVGQHPDRARMCGFGDKDRRPISPPPCVRMVIVKEDTNEEIDYSKVENLSRYCIFVDLANADNFVPANIVHHPSASPSISSTVHVSYPMAHTNVVPPAASQIRDYDSSRLPMFRDMNVQHPPSTHFTPLNGNEYANGTTQYSRSPAGQTQQQNSHLMASSYPAPSQTALFASGTSTRNLIGSLTASAFKLHDTEGKIGLWFIFPDLSIRTEGEFRLKFTLFDLMSSLAPDQEAAAPSVEGEAPCLALIFSNAFQVWSAKKFPGVTETTPLSRCFGQQGVKIPIRKDTGNGKRRRRDDDDGADDDDGEGYDMSD